MTHRFALIIGAMKCGTTSLYAHLSRHPQILACREKEPQFFTDDAQWPGGFTAYRSLWPSPAAEDQIALEASTNYTKLPAFPSAAKRIAQFPAEFRFIYMLRHPIERIESHLTHALADGWLQSLPSAEIQPHFINISRYAMQIAEYYRRFPRGNILLIRFEDFAANPQTVVQQVCRFLEIDPNFSIEHPGRAHNANRERLLARKPLLGPAKANPVVSSLARVVPTRLVRALRTRLPRSGGENVSLSQEQRIWVLDQLKPDLVRLRDEFGFDIAPWKLELPDQPAQRPLKP